MGYYVISNHIPFGGIRIKKLKPPQKRKDNNMYKQLADVSLKTLDMINKNAEGINKLAEFLHENQNQLNMLATKVLELEKKLEVYERPKN